MLRKTSILALFVIVVSMAACSEVALKLEATQIPEAILTPSGSEMAALECDPNQIIVRLRESLPYKEAAISHNTLEGTRSLNLWFVEPELGQAMGITEVEDTAELAIERSIQLAHWVSQSEACVKQAFDNLTFVAVDAAYNAWTIGSIPPKDLPDQESLEATDILALKERAIVGYRRNEQVVGEDQAAPEWACNWGQARAALQSLFVSARLNVSFSYFNDQNGGEIWAQWDAPPWLLTSGDWFKGFLDPLNAVDEAITCLYPRFHTLHVTYVLPDGTVELIAIFDGDTVRAQEHDLMLDRIMLIYARAE